jgi:hypothetical protein
MMRPLVALGVFRETDIQTYASASISEVLTAPPLIGGYQFMYARFFKDTHPLRFMIARDFTDA